MEILHNLWNIVSTEDANLMKYVSLSLIFVEIYVVMKLATSILNVNYSKKQRNTYIITMSILIIVSNLLVPKNYAIFIHLILSPILIKVIFKAPLLKSILSAIAPMLVCALLESIYLKLCLNLCGIDLVKCSNIIIYRIPFMLFIYLTVFILAKLISLVNFNINYFESLNKSQRRLLVFNILLLVVCIGLQFYLIAFFNSTLPFTITILSFIFLLTYSIVSIYSIMKTINLENTKSSLEQSELHNKTLELLYNNIRAFRHDFSNILTAFGGYIYANDMDGIKKYYDKILDECRINNNLSTLNPQIINNAAIYNILATKYYKADESGINIDLKIFIDLNDLKMDIYDFSRILGILLDNAIEAASQSNEKLIKIEIRDIKHKNCQLLTIENSYCNKDINIDELFEKGYTTKTEDKENHGVGLWQVSKMVKKHNNVLLDTSKNQEFFKQELAIYYK